MSQQIAVRLPDDLAADLDRVATARATTRARVVVDALRHEVRREQQHRDAEIIAAHGGRPYPDLNDAIEWASRRPLDID
ncbi:MAG: YlcI/YnfO family protein [Phycicoccus sp.]